MNDVPIDGQVLMLTAAKASVPADRLPDLVERAQTALEADLDQYRREYERVYAGPGTDNGDEDADRLEAFLVEWGHWETVGEELGFDRRERAAVRRAHEEQLLRLGRRADREDEFETSLEIREPVLVGVDAPDADGE
ncbi:hypothetical protein CHINAEXTREME_01535 [Halobiforma lacisalsi AJ5]|uniref:DUF8048 domain-containing protein n=1 Tax=Natronobacterium lacisalsi AJ5 TaxID=358396 RepID=M0LIE0_NATLA|nr:hypothetical protein [Halobiforma lacisalsi]APW96528.1 hypothetical protein CHINAEXTREME_01535 [Halobiforma lacisalsi AJ5]EMA32194.1 hypothetical protein C445_12806 [Halobiforma lacisalsi AJ5]